MLNTPVQSDELRPHDAGGDIAPQRPASEGTDFKGRTLFESVVCDIQWSAMHIATIAQLMTAAAQKPGSWTLYPWRNLLQDNAQIVHLGLRYFEDFGVGALEIQSIDAMYTQFTDLKKASAPLIISNRPYSSVVRTTLTEHANAWRELAKITINTLKLIDAPIRTHLSVQYLENNRILSQFLREAVDCSTRRVNAWGEISLPTLAQRRQSPRIAVGQTCRVLVQGQSVPARLLDASRHGLGIQCTHPFAETQPVIVELQDRRQLKATVVWKQDNRFGLQLAQGLDNTDPLLAR